MTREREAREDEKEVAFPSDGLKFWVATKCSDGQFHVKAAFYTVELAKAYAKGLSVAGITARVVWD